MTTINIFRSARDLVAYEPGQVVFKAGDVGDVMYAVVEGKVDITLDAQCIETVEEGGIFGEMALVEEGVRMAAATATAPTKLAKVDKQHFIYLVQEHPTFALQVMKIMSERIRNANEH